MSKRIELRVKNNHSLPPLSWQWTKKAAQYNGETGPGCPVDCAHCNQQFFNVGEQGRTVDPLIYGIGAGISINTFMRVGKLKLAEIPADLVIQHLLASPLYTPNANIIFENFTDPGLDWKKTLVMMNLLIEHGHHGALVTITKLPIRPKDIIGLQNLQEKGGFPIVMISHSGLPESLEPSFGKGRVHNMHRLHEANIPIIHSLRPLVRGINTSQQHLASILEQTLPYVSVTVPGGLVVDETNLAEFERRGHPLSNEYTDAQYTRADIWPTEKADMRFIRKYANAHGYDQPIHKFVSCAISIIMTDVYQQPTPDRMAQWSGFRGDNNNWAFCHSCCTPTQIQACRDHAQQPTEQIISQAERILEELGYKVTIRPAKNKEGVLLIEGGFLAENILYGIKGTLGFYVNHFPNEQELISAATNLISDKLGVSFIDSIKQLYAKDDLWHITFKSTVDESLAQAILNWIRGNLRVPIVIDQPTGN